MYYLNYNIKNDDEVCIDNEAKYKLVKIETMINSYQKYLWPSGNFKDQHMLDKDITLSANLTEFIDKNFEIEFEQIVSDSSFKTRAEIELHVFRNWSPMTKLLSDLDVMKDKHIIKDLRWDFLDRVCKHLKLD
jgi:hypothetical protein